MRLAMASSTSSDRVRVDKWLWAARFFKTRTLATEAVDGGKVHVNGDRVKAARLLRVGDRVRVRRGTEEFDLVVTGLADHRGSATAAQALYDESEESVTRRLAQAEQQRNLATVKPRLKGRPDKKTRRGLIRMSRQDLD
jgi:ribosome-associated heat shock protein Hsp15